MRAKPDIPFAPNTIAVDMRKVSRAALRDTPGPLYPVQKKMSAKWKVENEVFRHLT